jgi:hypothetical protein
MQLTFVEIDRDELSREQTDVRVRPRVPRRFDVNHPKQILGTA